MYDERKEEETLQTFIQISFPHILSTDHEFIPPRNASLAAMHGSATGSNGRYNPTQKHSPLKERNEQVCYKLKLPDVCS
jgi:hypothetical protein